jgi:hypothetical protein
VDPPFDVDDREGMRIRLGRVADVCREQPPPARVEGETFRAPPDRDLDEGRRLLGAEDPDGVLATVRCEDESGRLIDKRPRDAGEVPIDST